MIVLFSNPQQHVIHFMIFDADNTLHVTRKQQLGLLVSWVFQPWNNCFLQKCHQTAALAWHFGKRRFRSCLELFGGATVFFISEQVCFDVGVALSNARRRTEHRLVIALQETADLPTTMASSIQGSWSDRVVIKDELQVEDIKEVPDKQDVSEIAQM